MGSQSRIRGCEFAWDDFDFSDERFVRTPFLQSKIERYIKELTVQVPDSLIKEADFMVNKAIAGKNTADDDNLTDKKKATTDRFIAHSAAMRQIETSGASGHWLPEVAIDHEATR